MAKQCDHLPPDDELRLALKCVDRRTTFFKRVQLLNSDFEARGMQHAGESWVAGVLRVAAEYNFKWDARRRRLRRTTWAWIAWPGVFVWAPALALSLAASPLFVWWLWRDADKDLIYLVASQAIALAIVLTSGLVSWAYRNRPNQPLSPWERHEMLTVRLDTVTQRLLQDAVREAAVEAESAIRRARDI